VDDDETPPLADVEFAGLAFDSSDAEEAAKLGVFVASVVAGATGAGRAGASPEATGLAATPNAAAPTEGDCRDPLLLASTTTLRIRCRTWSRPRRHPYLVNGILTHG
jgi:hypothetical protein